MRVCFVLAIYLCLPWINGCRTEVLEVADGFCDQFDLGNSSRVDMTMQSPKCTAAKGLPGSNVLCVDMNGQTVDGLKALDWTGFKDGNGVDRWDIIDGKLQVKNFSTFMMSSCSFTMPAINLNDVDKQKYKSVTLSVVQRVDMADQQQIAQIFLGTDLPARQMWYGTGRNPRQTSTLNIVPGDLPTGLNGVYQFLFKLNATQPGSPVQNWFIESIAVNLVP